MNLTLVDETFRNYRSDGICYSPDGHRFWKQTGKEIALGLKEPGAHWHTLITRCKVCWEFKPPSKYMPYKNPVCKKCEEAIIMSWAEAEKEDKKINDEKVRRNAWDRTLRNKYGISIGDYDRMYSEQNGSCKICRKVRKLCVDHCHITGRVRGLLCIGCNVALGAFGDDPLMLETAKNYLIWDQK